MLSKGCQSKLRKQNINKLIDADNILMVARWERVRGMGEKGEGIKKYRLVVTEQSRGGEVQHGACSP